MKKVEAEVNSFEEARSKPLGNLRVMDENKVLFGPLQGLEETMRHLRNSGENRFYRGIFKKVRTSAEDKKHTDNRGNREVVRHLTLYYEVICGCLSSLDFNSFAVPNRLQRLVPMLICKVAGRFGCRAIGCVT